MLETQDHGAVRELRLARPPVNAFGSALTTALVQAIEVAEQQAAADGSIRALVLSGAPGIFSAGLDVREVTGSTDTAMALVHAFSTLQQRLARCCGRKCRMPGISWASWCWSAPGFTSGTGK